MMHIMDSNSRLYTAMNMPDTSMDNLVPDIEVMWLSKFWSPITMVGDDDFNNEPFRSYLINPGNSSKE